MKRAYVELREHVDYLQRLAFYTITEEEAAQFEWVHLTGSKPEDIDVVLTVDEVDMEKQQKALDCYVTYRETIEKAGARRNIPREAVFEIFQEACDPPLDDLFGKLKGTGEAWLTCSLPCNRWSGSRIVRWLREIGFGTRQPSCSEIVLSRGLV